MDFISLSFILIYCNQAALCLMACDKELSALSEAWARPLRMLSIVRLIRFVTHHTNNLPDRAYRVFNVYSQVIYLQREGKLELNHQCFINSDLWIFQQLRSSSNASQVNLGEACWELGCVCRLLDMHSVSFTCIRFSFSFVLSTNTVHFLSVSKPYSTFLAILL